MAGDQTQRSGWLRWAVLICVATALGVVTTIGVALGAHRWAGPGPAAITAWTAPSGNKWFCKVWTGVARDVCNVQLEWHEPPRQGEWENPVMGALPHTTWRVAAVGLHPAGAIPDAFINGQAYGWPMRALSGVSVRTPFGPRGFGWTPAPAWMSGSRDLPVAVLWPGLVIDSLLFGACWMPVLLVPAAIRRIRRRMAGACPHCGYDLRGLTSGTCPECGNPMAPTSAANPPQAPNPEK